MMPGNWSRRPATGPAVQGSRKVISFIRVTLEVVESQDKGRGYEIGKNEYLPVEDEELDSLALESTHTIDY
jgi:non-homologous end joining protein Ku